MINAFIVLFYDSAMAKNRLETFRSCSRLSLVWIRSPAGLAGRAVSPNDVKRSFVGGVPQDNGCGLVRICSLSIYGANAGIGTGVANFDPANWPEAFIICILGTI